MSAGITWHYRGRLVWLGITPEGYDVEKDVKTGKVKRIYSRNEVNSRTAISLTHSSSVDHIF